MTQPDSAQVQLDYTEVLAELSERGRLEWENATLKATNRKLAARLREQDEDGAE